MKMCQIPPPRRLNPEAMKPSMYATTIRAHATKLSRALQNFEGPSWLHGTSDISGQS